MTEQMESAPAGEAVPRSGRGERRWMFVAAVLAVAVVVLAGGFGAYAVARDGDDDSHGPTSAQIAAVRQACQQWRHDETASPGPGPGAGWCDDMAGWMSDHMGGRGAMMGGAMWPSREALRDTCLRAMSGSDAADGDVAGWCDQMAGWMDR